jgi:hypothetical protein
MVAMKKAIMPSRSRRASLRLAPLLRLAGFNLSSSMKALRLCPSSMRPLLSPARAVVLCPLEQLGPRHRLIPSHYAGPGSFA